MATYPKLLSLLKNRGFISQDSLKLNGKIHQINNYGAPGTFLRHNIKQEWWKLMVALKCAVFPVESSLFHLRNLNSDTLEANNTTSQIKDLSNIFRTSLHNDCRNKYLELHRLANGKLPFSIASIGDTVCLEGSDCDMEQSFFTKSLKTTEMVLQNYVLPSEASRSFDYWLQQRLSWWKKFSKNPSNFKVEGHDSSTDPLNGSVGLQRVSVIYEFPWGPEELEVIENVGDEELSILQKENETSFLIKNGTKSFLPYCIQCTANLELAMAAFLFDSFHERKTFQVLQLHRHLSPFQVAIVIIREATAKRELQIISKELEQVLLNANVSVFNASDHVGSLNAHFNRNDQLGIPYTLVLHDNTLTDGLINSRDRDTEIKKQMHITQAKEEMPRNFKADLH